MNEQLEGFSKRDVLKSVSVEHEFEDEEVGAQDDGFPILCVDDQDWWWMTHTCNKIYKLETLVKEVQYRELIKALASDTLAVRTARRILCCLQRATPSVGR